MKISWNETINDLCGGYFDKLSGDLANTSWLSRKSREVVAEFLRYSDCNNFDYCGFENCLRDCAERYGITDVSYLFDSELKDVAVYLLGEEWSRLLQRYMRIKAKSPYTTGYYRRSVRCPLVSLHINSSLTRDIKNFVELKATGFSTIEILRGGRNTEEAKNLNPELSIVPWLAAMIDAGDRECINYLTEAMTSENNANRMTYAHFRAIAMSGNEELLELEGRLLLAARQQEGLRQAIVETVDEGCANSFIHMMNVIRENGLQRFAAVKRGIAVSTGLGWIDAPERISDKFVELVCRYIGSAEERVAALESSDAVEVYLALWAMSFYDVRDIEKPIGKLIKSAPAYRVEAAMLLLDATGAPGLKNRLVSKALEKRSDDHGIMAGTLPMYLAGFYVSNYGDFGHVPHVNKFFDSRDKALRDYDILVALLKSMKPVESFSPYVFPWICKELSRGDVAENICKIALLLGSEKYKEKALEFVEYMNPDGRAVFIKYLLADASTRKQIEYAVNAVADHSSAARDAACRIVDRLHKEHRLSDEDYIMLESHLRLKASSMRVAIISILSSLPDDTAVASVKRLLSDKIADRRLAGLDILKTWIDKGERAELCGQLFAEVKAIARPTSKEKVLIDSILDSENSLVNVFNSSNGYGLYDPAGELCIKLVIPKGFRVGKALTFADSDKASELLLKIMLLIEKHADHEFSDSWGERHRLGNCVKLNRYRYDLKALALPEMWQEFYEQDIDAPSDLLKLFIATSSVDSADEPFFATMERIFGDAFHRKNHEESFIASVKRIFCGTFRRKEELRDMPYYNLAYEVCECLYGEYGSCAETYRICADVMSVIAMKVDRKELVHTYKKLAFRWERAEPHPIYLVFPLSVLYNQLVNGWKRSDDELFMKSFSARYELYRKLDYKERFNTIAPLEYVRLWEMGRMTDREFWHEMIGRENSPKVVKTLTSCLPEAPKRYDSQPDVPRLSPAASELVNAAVDRILEIELKRGDTPTAVSNLAKEICVIKGAGYFIAILLGLGRDKPVNNFYMGGDSKKTMFSYLLSVCCPAKDDTPESLSKLVKEAGISDERLVEAAMFSPRWLELVEQTIGWNGLTSAAYYFLAHTGENLNSNVRSHISRYTAVAPEDFADGAFDVAWFREVYKQLGKKHFEVVYDAAKYISDGNRHTRSRKLSDAVLGNLKGKDVMEEIAQKRNKDFVVALGLIPLGRNRMKDLRQRYAFLNKFLKESKQFGSQRQASEGRAVKLALENLARTSGFGDVTRMTWSLESDFVKEVSEFLTPKEIDGVTVYILLNNDAFELVVESNGKKLQSIPARLKKDKYVVKLKEIYKQFKDQQVRGRALLETAMVNSTVFTGEEMVSLVKNPVIWSMLSRLVMMKGDGSFGFPADDGVSLISAHGEVIEISADETLRIAHPYDMMKGGVWSDFQKALFDRCWRQPFKQVFRELYVPTAEEKEKSRSDRYSGNQIMPARAAAVLKKRQWVVDYENGLQKVCFHGDVTAVMYAMADWFSPSDIEAPTLEYVAFYDRRSFKEKKIADLLPVVFSEIMRDVDLAVSVAHAGGVDPETSHSTIEMRRAIIEHAMPMFGITNVTISGNFAKVSGKLASYNIHLGSGVIHKEGGAQIVVLPVHSQRRGRIFLPFLDEDPKTAEIISKILLFAEDTKIKDPSILSQI
ncbi:MAG: DUF4132 domain-containing protein [Lachnospiraceae bacterium]|nr:DUF4132 domain-containing protein [Lachnospiraceae bacterium]